MSGYSHVSSTMQCSASSRLPTQPYGTHEASVIVKDYFKVKTTNLHSVLIQRTDWHGTTDRMQVRLILHASDVWKRTLSRIKKTTFSNWITTWRRTHVHTDASYKIICLLPSCAYDMRARKRIVLLNAALHIKLGKMSNSTEGWIEWSNRSMPLTTHSVQRGEVQLDHLSYTNMTVTPGISRGTFGFKASGKLVLRLISPFAF